MLHSALLPYTADVAAYFAAISDLPWAAWLDSGGRGRYDILVAQPVTTLQTRNGKTVIGDQSGSNTSDEDPMQLLRHYLGGTSEFSADVRFAGGALGYWAYDFGRNIHALPEKAVDAENLPQMAIGIYDWALQVDHQEKTAQLVSRFRFSQTVAEFEHILSRLQNRFHCNQVAMFQISGDITSNFSRGEYSQSFENIKKYLREGDCYQINLAQRFSARASGDAYAAYRLLRELSPSPYSAFLNFPFAQILCASPEQFLQLQNGEVETRPIKGTRPVRQDMAENARQIEELQSSEKDRAENLMIVDLLRNDLGKHCLAGSIRVPRLFEVQSFKTVHHLVSTITATLAEHQDALTLLGDCFPGGSITGAPKQRAMEIIEQLEPHRRGIYCGAIGYIGFDGNMDTNIAIRTMVYSAGEIRCWAGGGIVADSDVEMEYQETLDKAGAMLEVMRQFGASGFAV